MPSSEASRRAMPIGIARESDAFAKRLLTRPICLIASPIQRVGELTK
jgi:hypothetical protein